MLGILFSAIIGAIFGSFLNVVALRWHEGASLGGRSRCPSCKHPIRARYLIPVLSWLFLRGKCADCYSPIHVQYPIVEGTAVLLAVIAAVRHDPFGSDAVMFAMEFILSLGLLLICVMDIRWQELPLELIVMFGAFAIAIRIGAGLSTDTLWSALFTLGCGGAIGVLFFGAQWAVSHGRWLGGGDVWFGGMMGLILGWPGMILGIFVSYIIGGFLAAWLLLTGHATKRQRIPFAPMLSLGLLVSLWFGAGIINLFQ